MVRNACGLQLDDGIFLILVECVNVPYIHTLNAMTVDWSTDVKG